MIQALTTLSSNGISFLISGKCSIFLLQTAPDLPVQARWGHIPPPLHSIPVSRPLQQQMEGALPSQVHHGHSVDQPLTANRFTESRTPAPSDSSPSFTAAEMGLVNPLRPTTTSSGQSVSIQSSSGSANTESGKTNQIENDKHQSTSSVKTQFSKKNSSSQQGNNSGYNYQRGGMSQRGNMGNEYSHRRMGFHGRNQSTNVDKGFPASKIKQIYVAKQTSTGGSNA